ncbi:hypothetical protein ACFPL7_03235 [Dongia soli]|uniref:Uncharacterized protein n=1 Tax=Dongia soli TaxID=600628 RepID=A0ABU5EER1_9PROT|nr:hypothetical protein [Dongia soli]MDY0884696.1 hypothetical protein [Dongia soli]
MADGSSFVAAACARTDPPRDTLLFHEGDFHDATRLPGRALRSLAVTTRLRLAGTPLYVGLPPGPADQARG